MAYFDSYNEIKCYSVSKASTIQHKLDGLHRRGFILTRSISALSRLISTRISRHPNFRKFLFMAVDLRSSLRYELLCQGDLIMSLENKLKSLQSSSVEYLLDVLPFMKSEATDSVKAEMATLAKPYLDHPSSIRRTRKEKREDLAAMRAVVCEHCHTANQFIDTEDHATCSVCAAVSRDRLLINSAHLHFEETTLQSVVPYNRLIYFREKLRQLQGKSKVKIPFIVTNAMIEECVDNDIPFHNLSPALVRKFLRKRGLDHYLEQVPAIRRAVCPQLQPPDIPDELFKLLCNQFVRLDQVFSREYAKMGIKAFGRKSMISIPLICKLTCDEHPNWKSFQFPWKISSSKKVLSEQKRVYYQLKSLLS